jgi:LacI family transcriptional regulator
MQMPIKLVETKHHQFFQSLRDQVRRVAGGEKIPTIEELQFRYKVSRPVVERAITRLKKDGLIYRPAGKQRFVVAEIHDRPVWRVAMIRPDYPSPDFDAIARTVVSAGKGQKWGFDLVSYGSLSGLELETAIGDNDAAVLLPTSEPFPDHLVKVLENPRKPVIILQEPVLKPGGSNNVCINDRKVGRLAVDHLMGLGHRRILCMIDQPHDITTLERVAGWQDAMQQSGQKRLEELVLDCDIRSSEDPMQKTYDHLRRWLEGPNPAYSAIFCTSSAGAMAVIRALRERNIKIPTDISLVAYAGESTIGPFLNPPLTAVEIDMAAYGKAVAELLESQLTNPKAEPRVIKLEPYLAIRETTKPVKENA